MSSTASQASLHAAPSFQHLASYYSQGLKVKSSPASSRVSSRSDQSELSDKKSPLSLKSICDSAKAFQKRAIEYCNRKFSVMGSGADGSASAVSCCAAAAAVDTGKAADASGSITSGKMQMANDQASNQGGAMHLSEYPSTPTEIAFAVGTPLIALVGVLNALQNFTTYGQHEKKLKDALKLIKCIKGLAYEKKQAIPESLLGLERFLRRNLAQVRFIKWVPGAMSGGSMALVGLGAIVFKLTPPGLMLSAIDAFAQAWRADKTRRDLRRALHQAKQAMNQLDPESAAFTHDHSARETQILALKKELRTTKRKLISALLIATGVSLLIPTSMGLLGFAIASGAILPLTIAAIGVLVPGIILSAVYTPYKDIGLREKYAKPLQRAVAAYDQAVKDCAAEYTDASDQKREELQSHLSRAEKNVINAFPKQDDLKVDLIKAGQRKEVVMQLQTVLEGRVSGIQKLKIGARQFAGQLLQLLSAVPSVSFRNMIQGFEHRTRLIKADRCRDQLWQLGVQAEILRLPEIDTGQTDPMQMIQRNASAGDKLAWMENLFESDGVLAGAVGRMLVKQVLHTATDEKGKSQWVVKDQYKRLFFGATSDDIKPLVRCVADQMGGQAGSTDPHVLQRLLQSATLSAEDKKEIQSSLAAVANTAPCCDADFMAVWDAMKKRMELFTDDERQAFLRLIENALLVYLTDRTVGLRGQSNSDLRYYSRLLSAFDREKVVHEQAAGSPV